MALAQTRRPSSTSSTAILVSRFLIDLQEANEGNAHQHSLSSDQLGQIGSLDFNRVLGSLSSALAAPGDASQELPLNPSVSEEDSDDMGLGQNDDDPSSDPETVNE